jgi:hypothetical protein
MVSIYGLYDPFTLELRYVGKTKYLLSTRLSQHVCEAKKFNKTHRHKWIRSLLKKDTKPNIKLLKEATKSNWEEIEKKLISDYRSQGFNLVNETDGGESPEGRSLSKDHIEKIRQANIGNKHSLGHKHSEETKAKMRAAHKGRKYKSGYKLAPETIEKIREASVGRRLSVEARKKISQSKLGKPRSKETKQKLRLANLGKKHSEETKAKMRAAHKRRKVFG